jgi:Arc/MetJ-type ribon-helix-helix transcriptional regulator
MKITVCLPKRDVEFLDDYAVRTGRESRSVALHNAVRLLRDTELAAEYAAAWSEWPASTEEALWESTVGDGLGPA